MVLDEIDKEIFRDIAKETKRIADALDVGTETDRQGMEMASSFTDFVKLVVQCEGRQVHQVDVPPTVGDTINSLDPENVPEHAAIMEAAAAPPTVGDTYDPELDPDNLKNLFVEPTDNDYDPSRALVEEGTVAIVCPNCDWSKAHPVVDHGGPTGLLQCDDCGHCFHPEDVQHARESGR